MRAQHHRSPRDHRHRLEILLHIVGQVGEQQRSTRNVSEVSSQVEPSGGDFATTVAPIEADAPGRFSTTMVAPRRSCRGLQQPRHGVGRAAGGKRIDDPDHSRGRCWARAATGARIPAATIERLVSSAVSIPRSKKNSKTGLPVLSNRFVVDLSGWADRAQGRIRRGWQPCSAPDNGPARVSPTLPRERAG